ncbi:MAG: arylsulfatase [Melioribacteraceae bacterium]|nr:arylsulfatase [Melioribacteraceae bacterium]
MNFKSHSPVIKLTISTLLILTFFGCQKKSDNEKSVVAKPNIIYILADDLGYGDLGSYGQERIKTPRIDKMATEGMRFTDHYAGATVCAPSRSVLMTGLHTGHTYIRGNREKEPMGQEPLPAEIKTVAEYLKDAGYTTGLIGKWGLGGPGSVGMPTRQGFDYFYGYMCQRHAHNYYPEFLFRNEDKIMLEGNRVENPRPDGEGVSVDKAQYTHDLFAEEALKFVEVNKDNPFFLYLALTIPHANNRGGDNGMDIGMEVPSLGQYADKDWPFAEKGKAAMITLMDKDIGRLLDKLQELGIAENTLVIFTSDNGPHAEGGAQPDFSNSNGQLRGLKRDLYEGGIRVPMIAWQPGTIKPNTTSSHISAFWDFLPTACDIAGLETPKNIDGISFLPELLGKPQPEHEYLYWEFYGRGFKRAFRIGDYKYVQVGANSQFEMYNLANDIGETKDISAEHPEKIAELKKLLKTAHTESKFWKIPGEEI